MPHAAPLDGPADLDALQAFLASADTPDDCMTVSELDGFLAGVIASPDLIMPGEWLSCIWGPEEPAFNDLDQANAMLGVIMRRYNEIAGQLMQMPPTYTPILGKTGDGKVDGSDWAMGFIRAIGLHQEAWLPLLTHPDAGAMLTPIMLVASSTKKANLPMDDDDTLPPEDMEKLLENPGPLLGMCATGIRLFFMETQAPGPRRTTAKKQGRTGKARQKRRKA